MAMIRVEDLTFSYPSSYNNIFEHVNFQVDTDWKLGFVGRNGRGKTTFLNLLLGKYEYSGRITSPVRFNYFPYSVENPERETMAVLRDVCPTGADWALERELSLIGLRSDALFRPFDTLSGGERTKALLAALFVNEESFLLVDEPTNHLDIVARELVAAYLRRKKGFILVSHDRYFLDGCVDHILSLNRSSIEVQSGNFSSWFSNFERRQAFEQERNERLMKDIVRLKKAAQRTSDWSDRVEAGKIGEGAGDRGYIGHKAAKMMKRSKSIEQRRQRAIEEKSSLLKDLERAESLKLQPLSPHCATRLISCRDVTIRYDGRRVCGPVTFTLAPGERLALSGANGSGKTTLLRLLVGEQLDHTGSLEIASGLLVSYVPQDTAHLQGSLLDYARRCRIDTTQFLTILRKLDFARLQFEKDLRDFSGGQKKKVLIARSLCERAHLYVWDEPLNYVDIYSRIQIEELLLAYAPTMVFVEHDRAFRDAVATRTFPL